MKREDEALNLSRHGRLLGLSRSSPYNRPEGETVETPSLMRRIDELFLRYAFYGSGQIVRHLQREDIRAGHDRVGRRTLLVGLRPSIRSRGPASRIRALRSTGPAQGALDPGAGPCLVSGTFGPVRAF